jgi:ERCC4-type nuclease
LIRARSDGLIPLRQIKAKRHSTRQRRVLQALPGVGPDRAKRLLAHFGSVRACLSADAEALAEIDGIGPATARRIVQAVEDPQNHYGTQARRTDLAADSLALAQLFAEEAVAERRIKDLEL